MFLSYFFKAMCNINKIPGAEFNSKFKLAWNLEKGKSLITAEHYCITWTIQNLCLLILEEDKSVSSPIFALDSSRTRWFIKFYPNCLRNEACNVDLFLYRFHDDGPQKVGLTFKFGISLKGDKILWLDEKKTNCCSQQSFTFARINGTERAMLSESLLTYYDYLVIKCEMYVTYPGSNLDEKLLGPADYDLLNFAFEFTKLAGDKEIADFSIKVSEFTILTHKTVLAARSATFREILKSENSSSEIHLRDTSFDSIRRVLNFMYSGSFSRALGVEPPSVGLYECAEKFAVVDLMALLVPKYVNLRSVLKKSQWFTYYCNLANFTKRPAFRVLSIDSSLFGVLSNNSSKWRLSIDYDRFYDKLSIFTETSGKTESLHSYLVVSLADGNIKLFNSKATTLFKKANEKIDFPEFLADFQNTNEFQDLLVNDTLRLLCKLRFVVSEDHQDAHDATISSGPSNFLDSVRNFSNDIKQLYETSAFCDVTVKTRDRATFDVHRSVLFVRSGKFYSKFVDRSGDDRIVEMHDVDPDLVRFMFEHAYSGILPPLSDGDMLRLHKAAKLYEFSSLILVTLHHLTSGIDVGNFFDLLADAKDLNDYFLIEKCMLYISNNAQKIMVAADWNAFRYKDMMLCDLLIALLRSQLVSKNNQGDFELGL